MVTALAAGRARSDIDVLSRAGLPLADFMEESAAALLSVIPFVAGCFSSTDPATSMISSTHKLGDLHGRNDADVAWARIEYGGEPDPTHYDEMASAGNVAVGIHATTGGQVDRLERMADLVVPRFGYVDEARVVFADRGGVWATLSILRGSDDAVFDAGELQLLTDIAPALTRGIRTGLLSQLARREAVHPTGPAVLIIDAADRVVQSSPGAQERLAQLSAPGADPLSYIQALVSGARRFAAGTLPRMPRTRTRTADGVWLVLHAAPLGGLGDRAGEVVVTIEEARPQEVIDIVAAAFALTLREREVVGAVLRGADTKEIAASMHVSPYTVQDHLKSIFDKAGVTSRRELVARVYFDQYMPRAGSDLGADGWFTGA
ncbi:MULTISPECIES: helix-turn-helix transcriptional regulator [Microbacterium]|jgi:DNA-binding CsgD family transcriptional regulator|uniref:helix-turn-helix transcriptional regulator n=1 Tax=Microbacterium TaxID=33882 RepID=UPI001D1718EB|nr:helix-turn-helix transcriptional regulator [Microbacterium testaceum]MCC4250563.1 helix-turn-helix transcriptional regulator [Microbacterium testaceum]